MKGNLFKKFLSFSYGSWIGLIIGLFITIISARLLSPEDFGKAAMFTLVMNVSMIFIVFGTDRSFVRFFYEENEENRGGLLYNCIRLPIVMSIIISILIFIFNEQITMFIFDEVNLLAGYMLIIGIISQVIYRFGTLVIRMEQKGNMYSVLEILNRSFSLVFLVLLYFVIGGSYEIIIFSTVITFFILSIVSLKFGGRYWNFKNSSLSNLRHTKTEIIQYGSPLLITTLITWLFQSFDRIAIKEWSTLEELGLYAAAFKIVALLLVLQTTFSTFWAPVSYENFEENPENKEFYANMFKIVSFGMFLIAILSIAGKDIIVLLLGSNYNGAANIMPFLVFMPLMYTISETTVVGINFYKKTKWHIVIAVISCIVNIIGNWILIPDFGGIGASISTGMSYIIFFSLRTFVSLKYYKVNYELRKSYFMLTIIISYSIFSIINNDFFMNLLVGLGASLILFIVYRKDLINNYKKIKMHKKN